MVFYVYCPANIATGGTELLHQLCFFLTEKGIENYMVYTDNQTAMPTPERFLKYNVKYVTEYVDRYDSVLVLPETQIHQLNICTKGKLLIWWLSVNNYIISYNAVGDKSDIFDLKNKNNAFHFVQSYYAELYVSEILKIHSCNYLQDYINDDIINAGLQHDNTNPRNNYVLYNPSKGYSNLIHIIEKCRKNIKWIPIKNMSPAEISELMLHSKVYIDFGSHPGKDRIPREAAICGCNIITNTQGSAKYYADVTIPSEYKCENMNDIDNVLSKIYDLVDNYETRSCLFDTYRQNILQEKEQFKKQIDNMIDIFDKSINETNEIINNTTIDTSKYAGIFSSMSEILAHAYNTTNSLANNEIYDSSEIVDILLNIDYYTNLVKESVYTIIGDINK